MKKILISSAILALSLAAGTADAFVLNFSPSLNRGVAVQRQGAVGVGVGVATGAASTGVGIGATNQTAAQANTTSQRVNTTILDNIGNN